MYNLGETNPIDRQREKGASIFTDWDEAAESGTQLQFRMILLIGNNRGVVLENTSQDEAKKQQIAENDEQDWQDKGEVEKVSVLDPTSTLSEVATFEIEEQNNRWENQGNDPTDRARFQKEMRDITIEDANEVQILNESHD